MSKKSFKDVISKHRLKTMLLLLAGVIILTYVSTRTVTGIYVGGMRQYAPTEVPEYYFRDIHQKQRSLKEYKGKVVILHFWATWCAPCVAELPLLSKLQDRYANRDLEIITVSTDRNLKNADVEFFLKRVGVFNLRSYTDTYRMSFDMTQARSIPYSIILDGDGNMVARIKGMFDWGKPSLDRLLDLHLANLEVVS